MCWAFSLWDGEIKFDLHLNLWLCYQKQQHSPAYPTSWLESTGKKWNRLKKLTADKKNNYFCLEVNYSCGHQFQDILTVITFSLVTISTIRITRKKLSLSQQNYMKKDYIAMSFCLISPYIHTVCCITFQLFMHLNHHRGACHFAKQAGKKPVDLAK